MTCKYEIPLLDDEIESIHWLFTLLENVERETTNPVTRQHAHNAQQAILKIRNYQDRMHKWAHQTEVAMSEANDVIEFMSVQGGEA